MGITLYVSLGIAGVIILLGIVILLWPRGQAADPVTAAKQLVGIPDNLGRVDVLSHARRKVDAEDSLNKEARAEVEAERMRRRARADAERKAKQDAELDAATAPAPAIQPPAPAGN